MQGVNRFTRISQFLFVRTKSHLGIASFRLRYAHFSAPRASFWPISEVGNLCSGNTDILTLNLWENITLKILGHFAYNRPRLPQSG
jgi:hypothetical protein